MNSKNQSIPYFKLDSPILSVFSDSEFNQLTEQEKNYAYYFSKASWEGNKICFFQRSFESPALLWLLQLTFQESIQDLKLKCLKLITEDEWNKIIAYCACFFQNSGNYLSFGDSKFIPEVTEEVFFNFIKSSINYQLNKIRIDSIWNKIKIFLFSYEGVYKKIGIYPEGLNGYYSADLSKDEISLIDEFLMVMNISPLNTRLGKISEKEYVCLIASVNLNEKKSHYYKESKIHIIYGDFSPILRRLSMYLEKASYYASNQIQKNMIKAYINHFYSGDVELHKTSQRYWVKDIGPVIETNIGFIETYLDPMGVRAEFEGMVAIVDKKLSYYTGQVVTNADLFLSKLPWPKEFEKDKFLKPDFTSLSVLAFASSGTPLGINIPNYDDIRQEEGFKNVHLGNAIPVLKTVNYMEEYLGNNLIKFFKPVLFHKVIYHELLGHGCGKLFQEKETGELNFDLNIINPLTGKAIESWYKSNETWGSKFGKLSNSYEECRADSVALFYSCFPESTEILQPEFKENWKEIMFGVWTEFVLAGLNGLEFYDTEQKRFMQAHINGRFVILSVLLEAGENFITIQNIKKDDKDWIYVKIDKDQILTTGFNAIKNFLVKLNVYKATADFEGAKEMYDKYSTVNEFFLDIRQIIIDNKKPRRIELQGHIDKNLNYVKFDESFEGICESFRIRYEYIDNEMINLWEDVQELLKPLKI